MTKKKALKKELTVLNLYAIATGATLSSGFFLLPGLAYAEVGPAIVLCYMLAAIPLFPAILSKTELSTAMPKAGGAYFFIDRSLGPMIGTVGGLGTWFVTILKSAFALVGMGAYVNIIFPNVSMIPLAIIFALAFGILNLFGAKKSGTFQVYLVFLLLGILTWFNSLGITHIKKEYFDGFYDPEFSSIFSIVGFVYISYIGITKIASVAEEIPNPERNLPLAMFLAYFSAIIIYAISITVLVGVVPPDELRGSYIPVALAAEKIAGKGGQIVITIAAILAFLSVANAAILSASRYPLAMGRDHLMPTFFSKLNRHGTPANAIYITVLLIIILIVAFDATKIAKLASAFQLFIFALLCLAVIVMRESGLTSYDPSYRSPFYPWMQIIGIILSILLIAGMGWLSILFSMGLVLTGIGWYYYYARDRVTRSGAIFHTFARLGQNRCEGLDRELRVIIKEKGVRDEDPYDEVITRAFTLIETEAMTFSDIAKKASALLAQRVPETKEQLTESFLQWKQVGMTPVIPGVALPHLHLADIKNPELVIVHHVAGVPVDILHHGMEGDYSSKETLHAIFFLVSPEGDPRQHLRILSQIAYHIDQENFMEKWLETPDETELKEILLKDERYLSLHLLKDLKTAPLIGHKLVNMEIPKNTAVALLRRQGQVIIADENTLLQENDYLIIVGEPKDISQLYQKYH